jgi:hypothetical protein
LRQKEYPHEVDPLHQRRFTEPSVWHRLRDHAVSFAALQDKAGKSNPPLTDNRAYLAHLPESEHAARELLAWAERHGGESEGYPLDAVRLLEPVEVAALFDFGLTPRHLKNSGKTIGKYEKDNPQTAPLLQAFAKAVMAPKAKPPGPFAMPEYVQPELGEAKRLEDVSAQAFAAAQRANGTADTYVLLTVMFASVLFFGGIAGTIDLRRIRIAIVAVALALFLVTITFLATMPICRE